MYRKKTRYIPMYRVFCPILGTCTCTIVPRNVPSFRRLTVIHPMTRPARLLPPTVPKRQNSVHDPFSNSTSPGNKKRQKVKNVPKTRNSIHILLFRVFFVTYRCTEKKCGTSPGNKPKKSEPPQVTKKFSEKWPFFDFLLPGEVNCTARCTDSSFFWYHFVFFFRA